MPQSYYNRKVDKMNRINRKTVDKILALGAIRVPILADICDQHNVPFVIVSPSNLANLSIYITCDEGPVYYERWEDKYFKSFQEQIRNLKGINMKQATTEELLDRISELEVKNQEIIQDLADFKSFHYKEISRILDSIISFGEPQEDGPEWNDMGLTD